jgi:hypothetical protein
MEALRQNEAKEQTRTYTYQTEVVDHEGRVVR